MKTVIKNGTIVSRGFNSEGSILIDEETITKIISKESSADYYSELKKIESIADLIIDACGLFVLPGVIDDQVHFREPGAEYKATIESESRAAVLGGVTSFMDMPNNNPPAITIEAVNNKYIIAGKSSYANYAFYLGATNDNINEILKADPSKICGVKVFMGSSTGNMLVDNKESLDAIFKQSPVTVITHCEEESIIRGNIELFKKRYGDNIPLNAHPLIRSREACIASSSKAIALAIKYNTDLHILHLSTAEEIEMIKKAKLTNHKITGEICVHYLWFDSSDYNHYGSLIKCNPSIKKREDKEALREAIKSGIITVVATDHAPHLIEEKKRQYLSAPSGMPMIRHSLQLMIELHKKGVFTLPEVVEALCHGPAERFKISKRGFIKEGCYADLTLIDLNKRDTTSTQNPPYKCGWSPLKETILNSSIIHTFVNGTQVVKDGIITTLKTSKPLMFDRK